MSYIKEAMRTDGSVYGAKERLQIDKIVRLLHGGIGIASEAGELLDAIKAFIYYGKDLNELNIKEELGDLFWFIALVCDSIGLTFEEIQEANIAKLHARYPLTFTEAYATQRDLEIEKQALEKKASKMLHKIWRIKNDL